MIGAVLFDLDDTLFEQRLWLDGAWLAVAAAAPEGVDRLCFFDALRDVCGEGSDRGRIIDRALARLNASGVAVAPLVAAFRSFRAGPLPAYPGAVEALGRLRRVVPLGLVTDGDPSIQRGKLAAVGLEGAFDVVVVSDELGRDRRKPHPAPFAVALEGLGVSPRAAVHVGDRPDKDVAGADAAGLRAIRVRTGEYRSMEGGLRPWREAPDAATAVRLVEAELDRSAVPAS